MRQPNLVYLLADQLRYQSCGHAGDPLAHTPNLDHLAVESVDFARAVSVAPLCAPYRASLLTGKYPSSTGMVINELRARPDPDAFGHQLAAAGYDTAYIGKWHLYGRDHAPEEQFCPPGPYRLGFDGYWASYNFNHHYYRAFYYRDSFDRVDVKGFEPDAQTDLAIEWLRAGRDRSRPFALFVSYGTPHDPWEWNNCPEDFNALFRDVPFPDPPNYADGSAEYWDPKMTREWWMSEYRQHFQQYRRVYYAMVANLDWNLGRLLRALDEEGLHGDTILVFTSDHGEMSGAHGRIGKGIFYEEACRVPLLIRWPGRIPAGLVSEACINTPDLMPTLLGLMGLPVPNSAEGTDLSHLALGRRGPEPEAALLQGMGHTYQWLDGFEWRALRAKRYTYAVTRADWREYLFDNARDPYQMTNLAGEREHAERIARLRAMLARRREELEDRFEACTWYRDYWTEDRCVLRGAKG